MRPLQAYVDSCKVQTVMLENARYVCVCVRVCVCVFVSLLCYKYGG